MFTHFVYLAHPVLESGLGPRVSDFGFNICPTRKAGVNITVRMPAENVIQLRALLAEKFPGLRLRLDESRPAEYKFHPTALRQIDQPLRGGLPKGALTEIVAGNEARGSATLLKALLQQCANTSQIGAIIDGADSLEVGQIDESVVSRLLWIRCRAADEAIKAADLVLRDGNLSFVLLDLKLNPEKQLRKIPTRTWYRFQRLVEQTAAVFLIITPRIMVSGAQARIIVQPGFSLAAIDQSPAELLAQLKVEVSNLRQPVQTEFASVTD